jgi:hypothetical protein
MKKAQTSPAEGKPAARGEALWKETKERIAASNSKAQRGNKELREVSDAKRAKATRVAEDRRDARLAGSRRAR